jgi:predicted enzyme related to lactoylglutathione lyase
MTNTAPKNPFTWIEIYVDDMSRAQKFYEAVFQISLSPMPMPPDMGEMQMLTFPWVENSVNASGALVKMENMPPGAGGTLAYFACADCGIEESRVEAAGGKVLQAKMSLGEHGFCSILMDTEGNSIGLHSKN